MIIIEVFCTHLSQLDGHGNMGRLALAASGACNIHH
jgi:hypothetical protein